MIIMVVLITKMFELPDITVKIGVTLNFINRH